VTPEEEARAAELEAAILAEEKAADAARRGRNQERRVVESAIYSSVPLATRAAEEYSYVRRDVRRIVVVGGGLLVVLATLHVLVNVANVI
jgi:regulator of protease activity HflC (stomatin/prohibitin superfamily)